MGWLIFSLIVPFLEVVLRTAIECLSCGCHICEAEANHGASSGEVLQAWVGKGLKVAPGQESSTEVKEKSREVTAGEQCMTGQKRRFLEFVETWILPLAVLLVIVVYSAMAAVFYNRN